MNDIANVCPTDSKDVHKEVGWRSVQCLQHAANELEAIIIHDVSESTDNLHEQLVTSQHLHNSIQLSYISKGEVHLLHAWFVA